MINTLILMLLAEAFHRPGFMDLAVVLALLALAGGLVFARTGRAMDVTTPRAWECSSPFGVAVELALLPRRRRHARRLRQAPLHGPGHDPRPARVFAAAIVVQEGLNQAGVKAVLIAGLLLVANPVLTHATGRALYIRQRDHLEPTPPEGERAPMNVCSAIALVLVAAVGTARRRASATRFGRPSTVSMFGILLGILFFAVQAPDVALSEIVVGAVALPLMILLALAKIRGGVQMTRRTRRSAVPRLGGGTRRRGPRRLRRACPRSATARPELRDGAQRGVGAPERHITDVVTAVNFDLPRRRHPGGGVHLLRRRHRRRAAPRRPGTTSAGPRVRTPRPDGGCRQTSDAVRVLGLALVGPTILFGLYIVAHGHLTPGGGFQGGVVLATGVLLVYLAGEYRTSTASTRTGSSKGSRRPARPGSCSSA